MPLKPPPPDISQGQRNRTRDISGAGFLGTQILPSALGTQAPITGKLSFSAPTRIDGVLRGEIRSTDLLVIGESGSFDGMMRAQQLIVLGEVRGQVCNAQRVEIGPHGRVLGSVETAILVIEEGGILDGECHMMGRAALRQVPTER